eukprot:scaffold8531_cov100-Skeletonema_marinoi.AAC.2
MVRTKVISDAHRHNEDCSPPSKRNNGGSREQTYKSNSSSFCIVAKRAATNHQPANRAAGRTQQKYRIGTVLLLLTPVLCMQPRRLVHNNYNSCE